MKKGLIIAGASVLLLSGMVAGVFAKYQSTIDVANGSVTAKSFYFNAENKTESFVGSVKLAPGESTILKFEISNASAANSANYSEVNIEVVPNWKVTGELSSYLDITWTNGLSEKYTLNGGSYNKKELEVKIALQDHGTGDTDSNGRSDDLDNYQKDDGSWKTANWTMAFTATQVA